MRYSSENFSDFEFHDTELYLKDCENSNLRLTARYLNIHKEAEQNPHNCDMETDCAEILFENADIRLFETMEAIHTDATAAWPVLSRGQYAKALMPRTGLQTS